MTLPASDSRISLRLGALATICYFFSRFARTALPRTARRLAKRFSALSSLGTGASNPQQCELTPAHAPETLSVSTALSMMRRALRDTGFFDDVSLKVENSPDQPNAKIVAFYVREKPIIRRIEYRGIRSISESDLLSAFRNNKVELSVESWFDLAKLNRAAAVIRDLFAARGYESATVKTSHEQIPGTNAVTITFDIDEGPKT